MQSSSVSRDYKRAEWIGTTAYVMAVGFQMTL